MKILFWCEFFLPHVGGIEILVSELALSLKERGHDCEIITNKYSPNLLSYELCDGMPVHRLNFVEAMGGGPRAMHALLQQVREIREKFQPDVNHFYLSGPLVLAHLMSNHSPRIPTVTSLQTPVGKVLGSGSSVVKLLWDSTVVISPNATLISGVGRALPGLSDRLQFIPNTIRPLPSSSLLLPSPLPMDPPVLLCLGRLVAEKGFDLALRALALLEARFDHVRLIIAGAGPERESLEALVASLRLTSRVEFTGSVARENVAAVVNRSTLMIVPSRWEEPFGIVIIEAGMMGRPVVANRVGGIPGVIAEGESGLLVENENPEALARAVTSLLIDPDRLIAMGSAARRHVENRFAFRDYLASHLSCYDRAVASLQHP